MSRSESTCKTSRLAMLDDVQGYELDDNAMTAREISKAKGMGITKAREEAHRLVEAGIWEAVWKKVGGKPAPAYRRPRK